MATEGMFVVILTVSKGNGRLLTSPDIISRGFIYLRDSEELMGIIRQYLKQKVARTFSGRRVDLDTVKKEIKDELTHVLYDQTRRTPIVIPVINEIGGNGGGKSSEGGESRGQRHGQGASQHQGQDRNQSQSQDQPQAQPQQSDGPRQQQGRGGAPTHHFERPEPKTFPAPQVPDTEATEPKVRPSGRGY